MPSFADSVVIFFLALIFLGPKKLPVLARELGKWIAEFRRASNEFKMQMEEELRVAEQAEKQKKVDAIVETAPPSATSAEAPAAAPSETSGEAEVTPTANDIYGQYSDGGDGFPPEPEPIASAGEVKMMPPDTGLPVAQSGSASATAPEAIPEAEPAAEPTHSEAAHG